MITYVPVGDSYTKGEGAEEWESWPKLLTADLNERGVKVEMPINPARTGWLTSHVLELELPIFEKYRPTFSTLLIGVNDWVQQVPEKEFRKNLGLILDRMQTVLPDKKKIVLLTIPDFSVTASGEIFGGGRDVERGISSFNDIVREQGLSRHLQLVDIYPLSQEMKYDSSLIGPDGLHPSAKMYAQWEKLIFPAAYDLLKEK